MHTLTTSADLLGRCLPLQPTIALLNADYIEEEGVETDKPTAIGRLIASLQRALEIDDWLAAEGMALDDGADEGRLSDADRSRHKQRMIHLLRMRETHIEFEMKEYCLLFRDPTVSVSEAEETTLCECCMNEGYLSEAREDVARLASKDSMLVDSPVHPPLEHLATPYARIQNSLGETFEDLSHGLN
ncbi:hypothetical protein LTR86_003777 [Recurvomyces mirabilis]|nr:hypothetical protein LTR86_003777 [Recurvomyces mirabilis]